MSNSILCAIDISDTDEDNKVLETAAKLAAMEGAQLDVITVVPDFGTSLVSDFFQDKHREKFMAEAKVTLKAQVAKVIGDELDQKVRHIVACGKTYQEVLKAAEKADSSMIVVGAHKPDFSDYLLGANAARIIRHSKCSVHVVRF
ncbi:universal stress protein [Leucothrix sargassi]|nr:universal stress protein [Leucothrix sargassi]